MEKFHKYCLSVLLVIVCGNISGQITGESSKNGKCGALNEFYSHFLNDGFETSSEFCLKNRLPRNTAIRYKRNAIDLIGKFFPANQQISSDQKKSASNFAQRDRYHQLLKVFERQNKVNDFAENIYFKSEAAKIRNKDYLDLKESFETEKNV